MTEEQKRAFEALHNFIINLSGKAGKDEAYAENLWKDILTSEGVLKELAYYHDTGNFWDGYEVAGFHLTDILVWQVDHFKAYMDRREEMNRYKTERLFLESLEIMLKMEKDPEPYKKKMRDESGTDFDQRVL
ncbi:MAG: hypothetical protein K5669_05255 [Lachnospiraceae bacterium]|nr:hypothetical protein [Lachnospiraceae bacterium]